MDQKKNHSITEDLKQTIADFPCKACLAHSGPAAYFGSQSHKAFWLRHNWKIWQRFGHVKEAQITPLRTDQLWWTQSVALDRSQSGWPDIGGRAHTEAIKAAGLHERDSPCLIRRTANLMHDRITRSVIYIEELNWNKIHLLNLLHLHWWNMCFNLLLHFM